MADILSQEELDALLTQMRPEDGDDESTMLPCESASLRIHIQSRRLEE